MSQEEFKSVVGLDQVYIADIVSDTPDTYETDTPVYLAPSMEMTVKPKISVDPQYADDQVFDVSVSEAETDLEVTITNCPLAMLAKLTGKPFDVASGRFFDGPAVPPSLAFGFRSQKSNGNYRYVWYLKVQFSMPEEAYKTVAEKKEPQSVKLAAKAICTLHKFSVNGVDKIIKRVMGDDDTEHFDGSHWYDAVQTPLTASAAALTLTASTPAANATNVSKTNAIVLTFANRLTTASLQGITLLDDTPAIVTTTYTVDSTGKIVTLAHAAALAGSTAHTVVITVADIFGQKLSQLLKFTTAA